VLQLPPETAAPRTRLVELPGRGVTRVWECAGPPGAPALMLIHGVTVTAELNWGQVFAPLSPHFRVIAMDLRGHGDGIRAGWRFRLEDCADDIAALAGVLAAGSFVAVGYSMGGMVAQLAWRRHPALVSGLVLCATARNVLGSPAEKLAALTLPPAAAAIRCNPLLQPVSAEILGLALLGPVDDPAASTWARAQLRRTPAPPCRPSRPPASSPRTAGSARSMSPPRWWSPRATTSCRPAASANWPRRYPARRSTRWTPTTQHASPSPRSSPRHCSGHAGP